jgi:hypothetical protein
MPNQVLLMTAPAFGFFEVKGIPAAAVGELDRSASETDAWRLYGWRSEIQRSVAPCWMLPTISRGSSVQVALRLPQVWLEV